jgi:hypothetical protein
MINNVIYARDIRYEPTPDRDEFINSVIRAMKETLDFHNDIPLSIVRRGLNGLIWFISEVDGKYNVRYKSEETICLENSVSVEHEHVFPRKYVIDQLILLRNGNVTIENIQRIIKESVIPCIVSKNEHSKLKRGIGWDRYLGIVKVYDTSTINPTPFNF